MYSIELDQFIQYLVDTNLDRKTPIAQISTPKRTSIGFKDSVYRKKGLYISLPVSVNNWVGDEDKGHFETKRARINLIFFGNTSVFYKVEDDGPEKPLKDFSDWTNSSNHDSCWRYDGLHFITDLYFQHCRDLDPRKAPIKMNSKVFLMMTMRQCWVDFSRETDYGYKIENVEFIKEG